MNNETIFTDLLTLSRSLGEPARDLVILGDGNTSARIDNDTFWVKASGTYLHNITANGFTQMKLTPLLDLIDNPPTNDAALKAGLAAAKVDPAARHPSIETLLHALAIAHCNAKFIGHTHPITLNAILCSRNARQALGGHLFSESALYLGANPLFVPYADPGLPLALALKRELSAYLGEHGQPPRVFYLLNHGLVALGQTAKEVDNVTAMAVKAARILLGTYAAGGPNFLPQAEVERITRRPDEEYRRQLANKT